MGCSNPVAGGSVSEAAEAVAVLLTCWARLLESLLRRRRAIGTSCFHVCWRDFADIYCPLRHGAMSAAHRCPNWVAGLGFPSCSVRFCDQKWLALRLLELPLHLEDATHTSRAALRRGTAAAMKRSVGLGCVHGWRHNRASTTSK